jgi:hypothetical protein
VDDSNGRKIGVVQFDVSELIVLDSVSVREQMSRRLVGYQSGTGGCLRSEALRKMESR